MDFYDLEDALYIGEMTFYPGGGLSRYTRQECDYELGDMLRLPEKRL